MPSYLEPYAFRKAPFDPRPGRGPVLATRALREAFRWIMRCIEADHPLLCVAGSAGVGRSSLARVLPGRLAATCRVARLVDPRRSWPELRVTIADQLFLEESVSRSSLVTARSQGDRVVVVVDAAERADLELLKHLDELLDLRGPAREQLVQLVLLARDPAHGREPVWRWLDARRAPVHVLEPLSPSEIAGYLRKRIEAAGRRKSDLFSDAAALVVYRHSRGIPRRIHGVCDVVLEEAARRGLTRVGARLVDEVMGTTGR